MNHDPALDHEHRNVLIARMAVRVLVAHLIGLCLVVILGTIGTTAKLSTSLFVMALLLGGFISIPWIATLLLIICAVPGEVDAHPWIFAILGPCVVISSYWLVNHDPSTFLGEIAVSSASSSIIYLVLRWADRRYRPIII